MIESESQCKIRNCVWYLEVLISDKEEKINNLKNSLFNKSDKIDKEQYELRKLTDAVKVMVEIYHSNKH